MPYSAPENSALPCDMWKEATEPFDVTLLVHVGHVIDNVPTPVSIVAVRGEVAAVGQRQ